MAGFGQYLKDTRSELNHVAWPTQAQTIAYSIMVIVISVLVAFYLGFFDYLFTGAVTRVVENLPAAVPAASAPDVTVATSSTSTPVTTTPISF